MIASVLPNVLPMILDFPKRNGCSQVLTQRKKTADNAAIIGIPR